MATRRTRRTRVTLRCVRVDLELGIPPVEVDLGALDHPLIAETRRIAPAAPRGQKRILAIEHPLVYRLRHGRWRGATWLETDEGRFWLCAGAQRAAGSTDDAYEHFIALRDAGRLLPDDDDRVRDALERNARIIDAAASVIPEALADALACRGRMSRSGSANSSTLACTRPPPATRSGSRSRLRRPTTASSASDFATCSSASSSTRPRPSS